MIAPKTVKVFRNDNANFIGFNIGNHPFPVRPGKISAGVAVVDIVDYVGETVFFGIGFQDMPLICNGITLALQFIVPRQS
jgi:hypothetical protein